MVRDESQFHIFINEITHRIGWLARYYERLPSAYIIHTGIYAHDHGQTDNVRSRGHILHERNFVLLGDIMDICCLYLYATIFFSSFLFFLYSFAHWLCVVNYYHHQQKQFTGNHQHRTLWWEKEQKLNVYHINQCVKSCNRCKVYINRVLLGTLRWMRSSHFYR